MAYILSSSSSTESTLSNGMGSFSLIKTYFINTYEARSARRAGGGTRGISTVHCSSVSRFLFAISAPGLPEIRADRYL
jgi:hypothetical protein